MWFNVFAADAVVSAQRDGAPQRTSFAEQCDLPVVFHLSVRLPLRAEMQRMASEILSHSEVFTPAPIDPRVAAVVAQLSDRPELASLVEQLLQLDGPALARAKRSLTKAKGVAPA
jgi:hypothetical protein